MEVLTPTEKELVEREKAANEKLRDEAKFQLEYLKGLLAKKPWDAELDHAVKEQEDKLAWIEHKIRKLTETLSK